jgi:hypothetical protein
MNKSSHIVSNRENESTFIAYVPDESNLCNDLDGKTSVDGNTLALYACVRIAYEKVQCYTCHQVKDAKKPWEGLELVGFPSL